MNTEEMSEKLVEAQVRISQSLEGIQSNLEKLNDANILHAKETGLYRQKAAQQRNKTIQILKTMTDKYWWLILALIAALLLVTGYEHIAKIFIG